MRDCELEARVECRGRPCLNQDSQPEHNHPVGLGPGRKGPCGTGAQQEGTWTLSLLGLQDSLPDPEDVLDRERCLETLAALRHAKWFQVRS